MGGRGSSSSSGTNLGVGTKSTKATIDTMWKVNDYYKDSENQYNCQACTLAVELAFRGYKVEARGHKHNAKYFVKPDGSETFLDDCFKGLNSKDVYVYNGKAYESISKLIDANLDKNPYRMARSITRIKTTDRSKFISTVSGINSEVANWGNGGSGTIQVVWKGRGGHVFNVRNEGGKAVYYDGQIGKKVDLGDTLRGCKVKMTRVTRTDDLQINKDNAKYLVK